MKLNWRLRSKSSLSAAKDQRATAAEERSISTQSRVDAERVRDNVAKEARRMRHELEINGWTKLLEEAMGGH